MPIEDLVRLVILYCIVLLASVYIMLINEERKTKGE